MDTNDLKNKNKRFENLSHWPTLDSRSEMNSAFIQNHDGCKKWIYQCILFLNFTPPIVLR